MPRNWSRRPSIVEISGATARGWAVERGGHLNRETSKYREYYFEKVFIKTLGNVQRP